MLAPLTTLLVIGLVALALVAGWYTLRDRLLDDRLLLVAAIVEVALLVQAVIAVVRVGDIGDSAEGATFVAYAITLPFILPAVLWVALKEKTRWSMAVVVGGAAAVGVMVGRLDQIWSAWT
ncbi:hypothetical protein [Janibacter sp. G1551]|uniref:hypothetical protein n=1 Tax=Janibacter sp. G1551 TaxID=3420440 RepID=UPI003D08AA01